MFESEMHDGMSWASDFCAFVSFFKHKTPLFSDIKSD